MPANIVTLSQYIANPDAQLSADSLLEVRGFYTRDFISGDGVTPIYGNVTNGQQGPYTSITPTLNAEGEVVVPAHDLEVTTLSNPSARYFEILFVDNASTQILIPNTQGATGWQIPSVYGSPINFGELALYNRAKRLVYPPDTYFTADETILEIDLRAGQFDYAGVNRNGISSSSVAPANPALPIFVGDNDPRVGSWFNVTGDAGDIGAEINAAIAACGGTKCVVAIPPGTFSYSTTINFADGVTLQGAGPRATRLAYTGSGIGVNMVTVTGAELRDLEVSTNSASAIGIKIFGLDNKLGNFLVTGMSAKAIWITGNGSAQSVFTSVGSGRIDNFGGVGIQVDHAIDTYLEGLIIHAVQDSTTAQPLVVDSGTSGLYVNSVTTGYGLHGLTVIHSFADVAPYGGAPQYLFFDQFVADTCTGGDCWLFDTSLNDGANILSAVFTNSWAAYAGHNAAGSTITAGANGIRISGGRGIVIDAGSRIRLNAGNGILINSTNVQDVTIAGGTLVTSNNTDNNADQHGIYISTATANVAIADTRIGNILDFGGHQKYGIKVVAANADQLRIEGNDLNGNDTGGLSNSNTGSSSVIGNVSSEGVPNVLPSSLAISRSDTSTTVGASLAALRVTNTSNGANATSEIQFGGQVNKIDAAIASILRDGANNTKADLAFATRVVTTDANLTIQILLNSDGTVILARYPNCAMLSTDGTGLLTCNPTVGFLPRGEGATLASASTITPTAPVHVVSGVGAIDTITVPTIPAGASVVVTFYPTAAWTWTNAGNIAIAGTAVPGRAVIATWIASISKWSMSY